MQVGVSFQQSPHALEPLPGNTRPFHLSPRRLPCMEWLYHQNLSTKVEICFKFLVEANRRC